MLGRRRPAESSLPRTSSPTSSKGKHNAEFPRLAFLAGFVMVIALMFLGNKNRSLSMKVDRQSYHVERLSEELKRRSKQGPQSNNELDEIVMKSTIDELVKRQDLLKEALQGHSRKLLALQFGEGPYIVNFSLRLPGKDFSQMLTMELNGEATPYTTHHFLTQVSLGLWSDTSFIRNAHHVIQASARPPPAMKLFKESGLASVAFQEYDASFPHVQYTVGLAGRPGGPDFYVSMVDNTKAHGPGGQGQYTLKGEADPCFGKVVAGHDVLEDIKALPVKDGGYKMLVDFVQIESAQISTGMQSRLM